MSLKEQIKGLLTLSGYLPDKDLEKELLKIIYNRNKEKTLGLFLEIQELDRLRLEKEKQLLYLGLQDSMQNLSSLCRRILEGKDMKEVKKYTEIMFKDDNIAYLINICKAYFPNANSKGASNIGIWFFNNFKQLLIKNKHKYLEGGNSYNWANTFEHSEYINKILKTENNEKI